MCEDMTRHVFLGHILGFSQDYCHFFLNPRYLKSKGIHILGIYDVFPCFYSFVEKSYFLFLLKILRIYRSISYYLGSYLVLDTCVGGTYLLSLAKLVGICVQIGSHLANIFSNGAHDDSFLRIISYTSSIQWKRTVCVYVWSF